MSAYFSNTPVAFYDSTTFIKIDSVSLNNHTVPFVDMTQNYYNVYGISGYIGAPLTWKVTSHNGITPSFTYTNYDSLPRYTGYSTLPDTIFINKPLTVNVTGLYNMDSLMVFVQIGSNVTTAQHAVVPKGGHSISVTFPQYQVAALSPSQNGDITVGVQKVYPRKILGKDFYFESWYTFFKFSVIVI